MPCEVRIHKDPYYVEGTFCGLVTPEELAAAARTLLDAAYQTEPALILADLSTLGGGHSASDLASLSNSLEFRPGTREAIVFPLDTPTEALTRVTTWARTSAGRGLEVRLFNNRERALDWLLGPAEGAFAYSQ